MWRMCWKMRPNTAGWCYKKWTSSTWSKSTWSNKFFKSSIVGQFNSKKQIAVSVYLHYKRLQSPEVLEKSNVCMIGPTGSGKTLAYSLPITVTETTVTNKGSFTLTKTGSITLT